MKAFLTLIVLLTFSLSSQTHAQSSNGWSCVAKDAKNSSALEKLKISAHLYSDKKLVFYKKDHCGYNSQLETLDACHIEDHTLFIYPTTSVLKTGKGVKIKLKCKEEDLIEPSGGVGGSN